MSEVSGLFFDHGDHEIKYNIPSPPGLSFSRTSSANSIDLLTSSSAQNTDDEDSDHKSTLSFKERRREAHTQAEQKRRDAIKKGYEELQILVPTCQQQDTVSSYKLSKATVLQKSIDYIQYMLQQKKKHDEELTSLRKELIALQIMKKNLEEMVKAQQLQPSPSLPQVTDEMKFQVFQTFANALFHSLNRCISHSSFNKLSASMFSWLEEYCKPQALQNLALSILCRLPSPSPDYTYS